MVQLMNLTFYKKGLNLSGTNKALYIFAHIPRILFCTMSLLLFTTSLVHQFVVHTQFARMHDMHCIGAADGARFRGPIATVVYMRYLYTEPLPTLRFLSVFRKFNLMHLSGGVRNAWCMRSSLHIEDILTMASETLCSFARAGVIVVFGIVVFLSCWQDEDKITMLSRPDHLGRTATILALIYTLLIYVFQ